MKIENRCSSHFPPGAGKVESSFCTEQRAKVSSFQGSIFVLWYNLRKILTEPISISTTKALCTSMFQEKVPDYFLTRTSIRLPPTETKTKTKTRTRTRAKAKANTTTTREYQHPHQTPLPVLSQEQWNLLNMLEGRELDLWDCAPYVDLASFSTSLAVMGLYYHETEQYRESFISYRDVLLVQQQVHGADSAEAAKAWHTLGLVLYKIEGCEEQAMQCFQNSLAGFAKREENAEKYDHEISNCLFNIGFILELSNDTNLAIKLYGESLRIRQNSTCPDQICGTLNTLVHIGRLHELEGDLDRAIEYFQEAIRVAITSTATDQSIDITFFLASILNHIGNLQLQTGDTAGMMTAFSDALRLFRYSGESDEALDISGKNLYDLAKRHPECARLA